MPICNFFHDVEIAFVYKYGLNTCLQTFQIFKIEDIENQPNNIEQQFFTKQSSTLSLGKSLL